MTTNQLTETYQCFAQRHQLAEDLPKGDKGVIIIGNTRSGKTTLACAGAGAAMSIQYAIGQEVFIKPDQLPYSEYVKHCNTSVTETPNFFPSNPHQNIYAIIDMPGHADNSRLRQLINFHYIKTMASNLKKVRFLIVLNIELKNGKYEISEIQFRMMEAFIKMFPKCNKNFKIIINKLHHAHDQKIIKKFFRDTVQNSKNIIFKEYFMLLTDADIYTIQKPKYKRGPNGQQVHKMSQYRNLNHKMKDICNNCKEEDFIALNPQDFQNFNILEVEGGGQNKLKIQVFHKLLFSFLVKIKQIINESASMIEKLIALLVESSMQNKQKNYLKFQTMISNFLSAQTIKKKENRTLSFNMDDDNILVESTIIQFLYFIKQQKLSVNADLFTQQKCSNHLHIYYSQIMLLSKKIFQQAHCNHLQKKIINFCVFVERRFQQFFFIWNIFKNQKNQFGNNILQQNSMETEKADIRIRIIQMGMFTRIEGHQLKLFSKIQKQFIEMNIPVMLDSPQIKDYAKLENELIKILTLIEKHVEENFQSKQEANKMHELISNKKKEIHIETVLKIEPHERKQINTSIENLLNIYNDKEDCKTKLRIIAKLAKLLERQDLGKDAIVLYFYLFLNNEVMRLVENHILKSANLHKEQKEEALAWLSELTKAFKDKAYYNFARNCLQHAKNLAIDNIDLFLELEQNNFECGEQQRTGHRSMNQMSLLATDKYNYWDWSKINQEIEFQKLKWKLPNSLNKSALKPTDIMLRKYRLSGQ